MANETTPKAEQSQTAAFDKALDGLREGIAPLKIVRQQFVDLYAKNTDENVYLQLLSQVAASIQNLEQAILHANQIKQ